jgi:very-short-patch-repair endonuclease
MSLTQARRLRTNMTDAERRLWYRLRAHRFDGYKFKRQVPVGPYVVDFACLNHGLVVELGGGQHLETSRDLARDKFLREMGFRVLRFWNNDALSNIGAILDEISNVLHYRH